ncbi:hypothetical protein FBEOM_8702 [Fusarium beomiforme]|uniref:Transaldolase n=1 Tax=Fusarium beomiforme TaxID=44412 RepID=A0A9P5AEN0_9HYPO|nr:hypothetical protein FBEOM_8702 [Fusarium beomiforme]
MERAAAIVSSVGRDESSRNYVSSDIATKRLDLLIGPTDVDWFHRHRFFSDKLKSDTPIDDIVQESFTYHESRMLMPSDRADIKELQAANTKRYQALLDNRFKEVEDSLATKLTMMYFGLPIAPIEDILKELAMALGPEEEVPLYNIKPPLHFLTAHDRRNWGKDSRKGMLNKETYSWPIPVSKTGEPSLSLRGGGEAKSPAPIPEMHTTGDYVPEKETEAVPEDGWTYLYSTYGRIPFVPTKWRSYALALRQLLHVHPAKSKQTEEKYDYKLHFFDKRTGNRRIICSSLPIPSDCEAISFIEDHFIDSSDKSHEDCCTLFINSAGAKVETRPEYWQPSQKQLETDTVRIGRCLGTFPNGPEKDAISYAYIAFPRTETPRFDVSKYGSQQYNAHFKTAVEILFGRPMGYSDARCSEYNHALFRLYDKNKPNEKKTIPIVYGAMGLPQWAWERLHPLNNPGTCWMIECSWLDADLQPLIFPNYYPKPNPYMLGHGTNLAVEFDYYYEVICDFTAETFDDETDRKLESVYVLEGDPINTYGGGVKGLEVFPRRGNNASRKPCGDAVGGELQQFSTWFFTCHPHWLPGHCRLFPGWYDGKDISVELPPLTSKVDEFFNAVNLLTSKTKCVRDLAADHMLLKQTPCDNSQQVQDMDYPSYLLSPTANDDEWYRVRESITSPHITVSFVKKSDADWLRCISSSNVWGIRVAHPDFYHERPRLGEDTLEIKSLNGRIVDPTANYGSAPAAVGHFRPAPQLPLLEDGSYPKPLSFHRPEAFRRPPLPHIEIREPPTPTLVFPVTPVLHGEYELEPKQEYDVGVLATSRPDWANKPHAVHTPLYPRSEGSDEDIYGCSLDSNNSSRDGGGDPSEQGEADVEMVDEDEPAHVVTSLPGPLNRLQANNSAPRNDRESTYTNQPSVFGGRRGWPSTAEVAIPLNAPPAEKILRTSHDVPMVSTAILTATEQADLQKKFAEARNMLLKRTMKCTFDDCDFIYRLDDHEAIKKHTWEAHKSRKCPWCDDPLFEWWDKDQINKHMREKHANVLRQVLGVADNAAPRTAPAMPRPAPSQPTAPSDTARLVQMAHELEQMAHSGRCHPPQAVALLQQASVLHQLAAFPPQPVTQPQQVAQPQPAAQPFALGQTHDPFNIPRSVPPRPAPGPSASQRIPSPVNMPKRPSGTPLAAERKLSKPPRRLNPLVWHDIAGPKAFSDPPDKCPFCNYPKFELMSSASVWEHFKKIHQEKKIDHCPFCQLPLFAIYGINGKGEELRKEYTDDECVKHMDCHIYELWDLAAENLERSSSQNAQASQSGDGGIIQTRRARAAQEGKTRAEKANKEKALAAAREKERKITSEIPLKAPDTAIKCQFFHKCGVMVGHMSDEEYRNHIEKSHQEENVEFVPSDAEFDNVDNDDAEVDGGDDNNDTGDERDEDSGPSDEEDDDDDDDHGGFSQPRLAARQSTPRPPPRNASPEPRVIELASDAESMDVDSNKSAVAVVITKKPTPKKSMAKKPSPPKMGNRRRSPAPQIESGVESHSEVASTVSRGRRRRSTHKATPEPPQTAAASVEAQVSKTKSSATEGRHRTKKAKKSKKSRKTGEKDGDYEDDGYETDDYEEEPNEQGGPALRRRANSPDWVKKLGKEDPSFDPDDDMYCSKCLRKAPKKRSKSPNRSPIGRDNEVKAHTDKKRCCRIRNAIGDHEHLPNRSGWIKGSNMPKKLTAIKDKFRRRYPTYARTIYPTNQIDNFASVWRSDPNNEDNKAWWDIPWPPYEGNPPFPGSWEAPEMPQDDNTPGRKQGSSFKGILPADSRYRYQSDSDSEESIHPDIREDISDLAIDATTALKRPGSDITSAEEVQAEEPAAKKARTETKTTKTTKGGKGGKKSGTASSQPSRASSRIRMQKERASPAVSTAASTVGVATPAASKPTASKTAAAKAATSKGAPRVTSKAAWKASSKQDPSKNTSKASTPAAAPTPDYDSSDPDR